MTYTELRYLVFGRGWFPPIVRIKQVQNLKALYMAGFKDGVEAGTENGIKVSEAHFAAELRKIKSDADKMLDDIHRDHNNAITELNKEKLRFKGTIDTFLTKTTGMGIDELISKSLAEDDDDTEDFSGSLDIPEEFR